MTKLTDFISDVAVVVGSAVGVGLISGKETQLFVGSVANAAVFVAVFCLVSIAVREFCRVNGCDTLAGLTQACFRRGGKALSFVLAMCSFVCVVSILAGVEQCLSDILYLSRFPLYSVAVAAIAAVVMLKGMRALKVANVLSVLSALVLLAILFARNASHGAIAAPKPHMPVAYALFTVTMSLSVVCRLGSNASRGGNIVRSVISAAILAALLIVTTIISDFTQPLPTLSGIANPALKAYAVIVLAFAAMCSLVSCAYPVVEEVDSVVGDSTVSSALVFGVATSFSMFGFDFILTYGYVFVAVVGAAMVAVVLFRRAQSSPLRTP